MLPKIWSIFYFTHIFLLLLKKSEKKRKEFIFSDYFFDKVVLLEVKVVFNR